jgi:hypothetical protein
MARTRGKWAVGLSGAGLLVVVVVAVFFSGEISEKLAPVERADGGSGGPASEDTRVVQIPNLLARLGLNRTTSSAEIDAILENLVAPPIDALVEEVDVELKLVVLSVGKIDEVKEGYEFTIYRSDKFIGKVRVHKVYERLAGGRVLFTATGAQIQQGDQATTRIN